MKITIFFLQPWMVGYIFVFFLKTEQSQIKDKAWLLNCGPFVQVPPLSVNQLETQKVFFNDDFPNPKLG